MPPPRYYRMSAICEFAMTGMQQHEQKTSVKKVPRLKLLFHESRHFFECRHPIARLLSGFLDKKVCRQLIT